MRAVLCRRYGGPEVLELAEVPRPEPRAGEVLVRIEATTVSSADARVRALRVPQGLGPVARLGLGFTRPRQPILGTELAGTVAAIGSGVTRFRPGDAVYAFPGTRMGCHADYTTVAEDGPIAPWPEGLTPAEAASLCFGGTTALHFLRKAGLEAGQSVLVLGASGAVGSALVQLARHRGARVAATTSGANRDLVAGLGAETVIDYTSENVLESPARYDIVADAVGATDFAASRHLLVPGGRYLAIAGGLREILQSMRRHAEERRVIAGPAEERVADVAELGRLAAAGHYRPPVDRVFPLSGIRAAHAYVDTGRKRGSVVVDLAGG